jgi:RES domain
MSELAPTLVCSQCFVDEGLRLDAELIGTEDSAVCSTCGAAHGRKLDKGRLAALAHRFFSWGSLIRSEYGAAPLIVFNDHQKTSINVPPWLKGDIGLIERILGVGFFLYGPRLWMLGEIEPLKALQDPTTRKSLIERILNEYPGRVLNPDETFYRIRKAPKAPEDANEYDSHPTSRAGFGRFDSSGFPVMYASPDLQVCIHECRVTAEDDLFVATLNSVTRLKLLDLSALLTHEDATEFESLDIAVHMLFLAGAHSYPIAREICLAAHARGFDGLVYPSYFSLLRIGAMPFETTYGISHRRVPQLQDYEQAKSIPNLALFGRPIEIEKVRVRCINKLILHRVEYGIHFGPVGFS